MSAQNQDTAAAKGGHDHDYLFSRGRAGAVRISRAYGFYVRFMRWGLSLAAAGLAVVIILWPNLQTEEVSFTLSHEDIEARDDQIRMVNPRYEGRDSRGRPFTVAAASGLQDSPDDPRIRLEEVKAEIRLADNTRVEARAASGNYFVDREMLELDGDVVLTTTDGYRFTVRDMYFDMNARIASGENGIEGMGPEGVFRASAFRLDIRDETVRFTGGVQVSLYPKGRSS